MRVVAITGKRECQVIERPEPHAADDLVVVKIMAAPMCTEYKGYRDGQVSDCLGHEAAGEVVEVARAGKVQPGDRVVVMPSYPCGKCALCLAGDYIHCQRGVDPLRICRCDAGKATYAQYCLKQDWLLIPIPDGMPYDHAAMACCGLGPTFGAMQLMEVGAFDTVLITGMGPVGLGGVINGVHRGARVIAVEGGPFRARLAERLGADTVIDPADENALDRIFELTGGIGVDKAIDCSGSAAAQRLLIDATRRKGRVAFVGEADELTLHVSDDMIRKGLTLRGAWHWNLAQSHLMMRMIADVAPRLDALITHTFPMSEVRTAWELQLTGECGKVVLHPWD
jgi:L-iditol 2-dehydrogenase